MTTQDKKYRKLRARARLLAKLIDTNAPQPLISNAVATVLFAGIAACGMQLVQFVGEGIMDHVLDAEKADQEP